jgi:hypothetical protein
MSVCLYSCLHYPACKTHIFCTGSTILSHIHKGHVFQKKKSYWTHNVCFDLLYSLCLNISHSKKSSATYYHKCTYIFMRSICHTCQILIKHQFSKKKKKKKTSNIKYPENSSSGGRCVACRHVGGQTNTKFNSPLFFGIL